MTGTALLTLGRLPKGLDVARAFGRAGWRVLVADAHKRHLSGASRWVQRSIKVRAPAESPSGFIEDLERIILRENVDLVLPVSEEILYVSCLHGRIDPRVRIFAMPQDQLLALHDKAEFVEFARKQGLAAPESAIGGARQALELALAGDVIVKPRHSCAGAGVRKVLQGVDLGPVGPGDVVQQFVEGAEYGACALAHNGVVQGCAIYRGFLKSGSVAVGFERTDQPSIVAWVEKFVAAACFTGFISFDLIVDAEGTPWGIECNPRLTSGVHFMVASDLPGAILEQGARVRLRPETRLQQFWACLTETQGSVGNWAEFRRNMVQLVRVRDVSWAFDDPWPLLSMPFTAWPIISHSRKQRVSFGEAASADILWRDDLRAGISMTSWAAEGETHYE